MRDFTDDDIGEIGVNGNRLVINFKSFEDFFNEYGETPPSYIYLKREEIIKRILPELKLTLEEIVEVV